MEAEGPGPLHLGLISKKSFGTAGWVLMASLWGWDAAAVTQSHSMRWTEDAAHPYWPRPGSLATGPIDQMICFLKTAVCPTSRSLAFEIWSCSRLFGHRSNCEGSEPSCGHLIYLPAHSSPSFFHPAGCHPSDPPRTAFFSKLPLLVSHHQGETQIEISQGGICDPNSVISPWNLAAHFLCAAMEGSQGGTEKRT